MLPVQGTRVQFLIGKLRAHLPYGAVKKNKVAPPVALNKVVLRLCFGKHPSKKEHTQIYFELQFLK